MELIDNLDEILINYDIHDYTIKKIRSIYKISSNKKDLILKKFNSKTKLMNTKSIISSLKLNEFKFCQDVIYKKNNDWYFMFENKYYCCFSWINGQEVNLKRFNHVKKCIKTINSFHKSIKNNDGLPFALKDNSNWVDKFEKDILAIIYIKDLILKKHNWNMVDRFYYENIDRLISILHRLLDEIDNRNFKEFLTSNKSICHNSLYYQNLILNKKDVYLIDFGGIEINNYIYDLSRFARRVVYKNDFNTNILNDIFELYNYYYKFTKIERKLFNILSRYPYKFMRFGYKIYIEHKSFDEKKVIDKLKKYSKYELII